MSCISNSDEGRNSTNSAEGDKYINFYVFIFYWIKDTLRLRDRKKKILILLKILQF